jgi:hypothetical protein
MFAAFDNELGLAGYVAVAATVPTLAGIFADSGRGGIVHIRCCYGSCASTVHGSVRDCAWFFTHGLVSFCFWFARPAPYVPEWRLSGP